MNSQPTKNYQIRNLHSYIKKDNLDAFIELLKKRPSLLNFKNFKNENILFYSLLSNSEKISSYLMVQKPSLLLERNNLGRNPAQNIASKKIDLETFFKGLSLLNHKDIYQVFSNIDNLGNNLLMYTALYSDINYYYKSLDVCPNVQKLMTFQNKKKSNVLHFLVSNSTISSDLKLDNHDNSLFMQTTINKSNVAMFAAENQSLSNFIIILDKYKKILSKDDFKNFILSKNSLSFSLLDFALMNIQSHNAQYLLNNYKNELDNKTHDTNILTIAKTIIKNKNYKSFEILLDFYKPMETNYSFILSILPSVLNNNESNPEFLNYLLEKNMKDISKLFIYPDYENSIYSNNLDKINSKQWEYIFSYSKDKEDLFRIKKEINTIFSLMMYNPKYQEKNLEIMYDYLITKKSDIDLENYISQTLLLLPNNTVKKFLENGFLNKCKNKDIDALIYLIQELYDVKEKIPFQELKISTVINYYPNSYNTYPKNISDNQIINFSKILDDENLIHCLFQISNIESTIVSNLAKSSSPFTNYCKVKKYLDKHYNKLESENMLTSLIYEITYLPEGEYIYKMSEWNIFKEIYSNNLNTTQAYNENEKKEKLENLLDILNKNIIPYQNIKEQLIFLQFIGENILIDKSKKIPLIDYSFVQKTKVNLLNNIQTLSPNEQKESIEHLIQINSYFFKNKTPLYIPNNFLQKASKTLQIDYNKSREKHFQSFLAEDQEFFGLNNFYSNIDIDHLTLKEIVSNIHNDGNIRLELSNANKYKYTYLYYKEQLAFSFYHIQTPPCKPIFIEKDVFNCVMEEFLLSNQINNAIKLQSIYINNYFEIKDICLLKNNDVNVDTNYFNNIEALDLYMFHCPEKLKKYQNEILNNMDYLMKTSHSNDLNYISILNLLEKIDSLEIFPDYIKDIIENKSKNIKKYTTFIDNFILRNKDSIIFDNIDYEKIDNFETRVILENAYMNRKIEINKNTKPNKISKF